MSRIWIQKCHSVFFSLSYTILPSFLDPFLPFLLLSILHYSSFSSPSFTILPSLSYTIPIFLYPTLYLPFLLHPTLPTLPSLYPTLPFPPLSILKYHSFSLSCTTQSRMERRRKGNSTYLRSDFTYFQ